MIEVAIIENEPTNEAYYSGPMSDYLNQLKISVDSCHKYNVKVADGCTHVEYINAIVDNIPKAGENKNIPDVKELIAGYKNIPLDYVNIHTSSNNNRWDEGKIKKAADYLTVQTGKKVICNEWSTVDCSPRND